MPITKVISPPLAHVVFILDDSGSMKGCEAVTQAAFNTFLEVLKDTKGAEIKMTLVKFGGREEVVYLAKLVYEIPPMDDYSPGKDTTFLYKAISNSIEMAESAKWGNKTTVIIQTDGSDNAGMSGSYHKAACEAVKRKTSQGWEFMYMGMGPDADRNVPVNLGIPRESQKWYESNSRAISEAFQKTGEAVASFSTGRTDGARYG